MRFLLAALLALSGAASAQTLTVTWNPSSSTGPFELRNDTHEPVRIDSVSVERSGLSSAVGWSLQYTVDTLDRPHSGSLYCAIRSERPSAGGSGHGCFFDTQGLFGRVLAPGRRIVFHGMTPICGPALRAAPLRAAPLSDTLVLFADGAATGQAVAIPDGGLSTTANFVSLFADQPVYSLGATVRLTRRFTGASWQPTGVLGCAQIETWRGGAWVASPVGTGRACSMTGPVRDPDLPVTGTIVLDVPDGTYRVVQPVGVRGIEDTGFITVAATPAFCVGAIPPRPVPPASPSGHQVP